MFESEFLMVNYLSFTMIPWRPSGKRQPRRLLEQLRPWRKQWSLRTSDFPGIWGVKIETSAIDIGIWSCRMRVEQPTQVDEPRENVQEPPSLFILFFSVKIWEFPMTFPLNQFWHFAPGWDVIGLKSNPYRSPLSQWPWFKPRKSPFEWWESWIIGMTMGITILLIFEQVRFRIISRIFDDRISCDFCESPSCSVPFPLSPVSSGYRLNPHWSLVMVDQGSKNQIKISVSIHHWVHWISIN